jgi:hypothetical protein
MKISYKDRNKGGFALNLVLLIVIIIIGVFIYKNNSFQKEVTNFIECVSGGNPVMESYPRQCMSREGKVFVEDVGNQIEKMDLIRLDLPRPGDVVGSPIKVRGEARGYWFFEASFPVILVDWDGRIIGEGIATANGEWMTEDFVPFEAEIIFDNSYLEESYSNRGALILKKDNPSGLPEHDDALEIPILLK